MQTLSIVVLLWQHVCYKKTYSKNMSFGSLYNQQKYLYFLSYCNKISLHNKTGNVGITLHLGAFVQLLFQWKSNKYYIFGVCVCCVRYPAYNAHAPYCHLWPAPLCGIFAYLVKSTIFKKEFLNTQSVFWFSLHCLPETFFYSRRNERNIKKCTSVIM
jgi:hypothetical protein